MANPVLTTLKRVFNALIDQPRELFKRALNLARGVKDVNVLEARTLIEQGAFVLDVREAHEFAAGHLAGSTLIPLGSLADRVVELEGQRSQQIVVICHGGKRSATACQQLAQLGFARSYNVAGGILAWKKARLPVVS